MKITKYAPVIIPTLNRYNHLKRCLESIERCTGADKTDVYIGLDYPPSEKYVDGWKKIDVYLAEKEKNNGFNRLIVCRRNHNCGVGWAGSNYQLLINEVSFVSDRFIETEDDNEFSPNFLEFINQGLELYKDDKNVVFVSAYTAPFCTGISKETTFFSIHVSAYGLGHWVYKDWARKYSNAEITTELKKSLVNTLKMYFKWPSITNVIKMIKRNRQYGDYCCTMYNLVHHTYVLYPSISLCRNWGCDGTGVNSPILPNREKEVIQNERFCSLDRQALIYPKDLFRKIFFGIMPKNRLRFVKHLITDIFDILVFFFFYSTNNAERQ